MCVNAVVLCYITARSLIGLIQNLLEDDYTNKIIFSIHLALCVGQSWLLFISFKENYVMTKLLVIF